MKGKLLGLLITVLLLTIAISGCFEENKTNTQNSELDRFVGTWYGYEDINYKSFLETWSFCYNRSLQINDSFGVNWGTYGLDGNELEIKIPTSYVSYTLMTEWFKYNFSSNDSHLILIFGGDEKLKSEFYKGSAEGFLNEETLKFIGKWSNQTLMENYGECGNWIRYTNYTFYAENLSVKVENNWCDYNSCNFTWNIFWANFYLDNNSWLCIGTGCGPYSFSNNNKLLNYEGMEFIKIE